jgi:hypothetical protein
MTTPQEYQEQLRQWQNLSTSSWNDDLLKAAAAKGTNWSEIYTGSKDLGGTSLSGGDAKLVSQYFAAKNLQRNEEWIGSNADSYWMRQLRDAQNWAMQNDKTMGMYQAELNNKNVLAKQYEMGQFQDGINSQQSALLNQLQEAYRTNNKAQQSQLQEALKQFASAQDSATRFSTEQEARRAQSEYDRNLEMGKQYVGTTASRTLQGTDADRYQGELQQQGSQAEFIRNQLGSVGLDTGFLSNYDIGAKANQALQFTDQYNSLRSKSPDVLINERGGVSQAQQALEQQYASSQTGVLDYDSQVRNQLSQLSSLYQAYNRLGNISSAQGSTGQEKVASLFGLGKVDTSGVSQDFSGVQNQFNQQLQDLTRLTGDNQEITNQFVNPFQQLSQNFNTQQQDLNNLYQSGANQLYGLYGDTEAMSTGRAFNEASRQAGLLSSGATQLGSTVSQVRNLNTGLLSKYNETANSLRQQRTNERNTYYADEAQRQFNTQQASKISNYSSNVGKQLNRVAQPEDQMLNRYSLFN